MKTKLLTAIMCGSLVLLFGLTSCKIDEDQMKEIAKNSGLFSSTTWIAIDNPNSNAIATVSDIIATVKEKASEVQSGQTYIEIVYPELVKIIDADVEQQYRPLCKAGTYTLLGQLDLLLATHPEWKENQNKAIEVTNAFIDGAMQGLSMAEIKSIMEQLNTNCGVHKEIISKK